jgi:DNA-binding MarR family transcriptional regulator
MSKREGFSHDVTFHVRDRCLCLHVQRAARVLARRFDDALRPLGLTSGQFSLLTSLNRMAPPSIGMVAKVLAMDRTTLTANLKPLERRKLVRIVPDRNDRRNRLLHLTKAGHRLLEEALPVWRETHAAVEKRVSGVDRLRADLVALS